MKTCRNCVYGRPINANWPASWWLCRWQEHTEKPEWYIKQNPGSFNPDTERKCECWHGGGVMEKCGHWVAQYNKKIYFNKGIDTCPYCLIDKLRADLDAAVRELQEENAAMRKVVEVARDYAEMLASNYPFDLTTEEEKFIEKCQSLDQMFDALDAGKEEP